MALFKNLFASYSEKEVRRLKPLLEKINSLEPDMKRLTDEEMRAKTDEFRERISKGADLDSILPEAFALVREAAFRVLGKRPFDVQIIGGILLHQGRIAEMKTGEGKTLVATLPAYLNALNGKGVHIVTVNDYLAERDSIEMGKIYNFLGLTVGLVVPGEDQNQKKAAYNADITYGTNSEYGFDYLRDNMAIYKESIVQRGHAFAIVDEVDSILIDEARTPLIISGHGSKGTEDYEKVDAFVRTLSFRIIKEIDTKRDLTDYAMEGDIPDEKISALDAFTAPRKTRAEKEAEMQEAKLLYDYVVDEKARNAILTDKGIAAAEKYFGLENLSDPENGELYHYINNAIRAHGVMKRDVDYIVRDDSIQIVDQNTGRVLHGRQYNDGLHQAIEAKEGVKIRKELQTVATITYQNFFRMYGKLSGMTGTAMTEDAEFRSIYALDVVEVPTNRPMIRKDHSDLVYRTREAKVKAIIENIIECYQKGQPVLVGTRSVEKSEFLKQRLELEVFKRAKEETSAIKAGAETPKFPLRDMKIRLLNAKDQQSEAQVVAQAGMPGAVTVSTNMAGRGTDIKLGGNPEYLAKNEMKKQGYEQEIIDQVDSLAHTDKEDILAAREVYRKLVAEFEVKIQPDAEAVRAAGGLFIIGTERHESRRIDNQLRGRSGRQGDPGESQFYLSFEDDLLRLFGSDMLTGLSGKLGMTDEALTLSVLTNVIRRAQERIEAMHFESRKNVLNYDDVMNQQRRVIYKQRTDVLTSDSIRDTILGMIESSVRAEAAFSFEGKPEEWKFDSFKQHYNGILTDAKDFVYSEEELASLDAGSLTEELVARALEKYGEQEVEFRKLAPMMGIEDPMREIEKKILLSAVDTKWMDHLATMDQLKEYIGLNSYAQRDPLAMYRLEGSDLFDQMVEDIKEETVRKVLSLKIAVQSTKRESAVAKTVTGAAPSAPRRSQVVKPATAKNIGRNDPCPCGSGKKYKACCWAKDNAASHE